MKVVVIGGGPAGMMAAITAARKGADVTLLEHNEKLGKKLFITGKGRCNLTNASSCQEHYSNAVSNPKFLYSALSGFDADAVCSFFNELGLRLKTERGQRVFPQSDHSSDVIKALEYELKRLGVRIRLNTEAAELITRDTEPSCETNEERKSGKKNKGFEKRIIGVRLGDKSIEDADRVILATGGVSYPLTGADASGFRMAEKAGIKVTDLRPGLVPLITEENWVKDLAGLSLKNVSVTALCGKKKLYEGFGEMLFTHRGVSGPLILSASSYITDFDKIDLFIDLKPALSDEVLDKRLIREIEEAKNKQIKTVMASLLPQSMIQIVLGISKVSGDKKACDITKEERRRILATLKKLPLKIAGTEGFDQAIITRGGISVKEIDPKTMGSKKIQGLYFAGECIDVDSLTGGFNLQIAWSTGYAAGSLI